MEEKEFKLYVEVNAERPDFRVFVGYFFGDDLHNYDSDGNSYPVTSRLWTELYMSSREVDNLWFDIYQVKDRTLQVKSCNEENVYRVAYFLAKETNGKVTTENDEPISLEKMVEKMGNFNLEERLKIAEKSVWRKSSFENLYPNLNE